MRFNSLHLCSALLNFTKHNSNESPTIDKSAMNTSRLSSTISEKMDIMYHWNVADALHNLNDICLNANVPYGHVNIVFS